MKTNLENALEAIAASRRKTKIINAWYEAEDAAKWAGKNIQVFCSSDSKYPDLERLEKDIRDVLDDTILIISRHPGVVEWLRLRGITGEVKKRAIAEDVKGRIVYGVIPMALACLAARVYSITMRRPEKGKNLTVEEMEQAGAILVRYA